MTGALAIALAVLVSEPSIRPQPGPQEDFLASTADIAIIGGAAGGGKTYGLLLEPLRHVDNPAFGAVVFRRTYPQIKNKGGLWDEAAQLYPLLAGVANENEKLYRFPGGMSVSFSHLQHAKDARRWTGGQVPLICFDQLEEFEEGQFWYLLTRNRSATAGVRPYVRATCNPVPDDDLVGGWLNRLISWWINPETGYAIPERSGVVRWFVRINEKLVWADNRETLAKRYPEQSPKSLTFIPAKLDDNPALYEADPDYRSNLQAMPLVERERLLHGNWKIKATAGQVFNRAWFKTTLDEIPKGVIAWVRYWDKAGTEGGGKWTAGALMGRLADGRVLLADMVRGQWSALNRETVILQCANADRQLGTVAIWVEQEPGSGGKESAEATIRNLGGFIVHAERVSGSKLSRSGPLAAQAEAGNVVLMRGEWNADFLTEAQNYDGEHGVMDQIDAASGAYNKLHGGPRPATMSRIRWKR